MKKLALLAVGLALLLLALLAASPTPSSAGGYYHNGYYYQQQYYQQNYEYQVNPVVVIGVPVSNLGVPFYWSVGQELREERVAERAAALIQKSKPEAPRQTPAPAPVKEPSAGVSLDFDLIAGTASSSAPVLGAETALDTQVKALLTQNCIRCHKPGNSKPGVQLFNTDGSLFKEHDWKAEVRRRESVYDSLRGTEGVSPMPKNAEQLADEKIELVYQWLREQMQQ